MAPYACIAQWSRPLLWLRISPNVLAINVYDAGSASIWALFGFQQLPVLSLCLTSQPTEPATTKPAPNNSLERQPGNHTPTDAGVWSTRPWQPGTRPMSDRMNHTPAAVGVWFYVRLSPNPQHTMKNHPPRMNETDAHQVDTHQMNPGPSKRYRANKWPQEPHTCYGGCVVLYKVMNLNQHLHEPSQNPNNK
ncbi:hypothetical protein BS47DRAFT_1361517 [Hydnum rufescens UP504]|uniref:Uncharacterized protein n=1 Tax=Hydnum rufescens UP504 TaxID=1448309 RepID=A0A9P6DY82_9AGAM|nr:hypothetical protein BS47DRAFT_1361517 [Hydnum rufescens UP504]